VAFVALLITRTTFSVASFMGLIMVIGIVGENDILLLVAEHRFRHAGFPSEKAMMRAGRRGRTLNAVGRLGENIELNSLAHL
jgi:multidrug efflux pump subunit AcrB